MFERFSEKARRSIFFARYEASQLGNDPIETEHLLRIPSAEGLRGKIETRLGPPRQQLRGGGPAAQPRVQTRADLCGRRCRQVGPQEHRSMAPDAGTGKMGHPGPKFPAVLLETREFWSDF